MQPLAASLLSLQAGCNRVCGVLGQCAASQVQLARWLSSLQPQQQQLGRSDDCSATHPAAELHQHNQLSSSGAAAACIQQQPHWCQHQLQAYRHYRPPGRASPRNSSPAAYSDSDSDGDGDSYHSSPRPQQRESRPFRQQQQQQQRKQQLLRLRRGDEQQEEGAREFQQHWRQHWSQQQEQQLQRQHRMPSARASIGDQHSGDGRSRSSRGNGYAHDSSGYGHSPRSRGGAGHKHSSRQQQQPFPGRAACRGGRPAVDPAGITTAISDARSLDALQQLLKKHDEELQQIHVCAAYKAVVRLSVGLRDKSSNSSSAAADERGHDSSSSAGGGSRQQRVPVDGSTALAVLRQLSARMQQQIRVARPWDLAQAAWACSKLQFRDDRLLEAIVQQAQRKAAILTPHDISQLASAYARLSYQHPALLQLLNTQAVAKARDFAPWVLVHTAWALHVCGQQVGELLEVAVPLLRDRVQELKELDVSSLLWLMAGHSLQDEPLLHAAAAHMSAHISSYSPASVANALMACAALGFSTPPLLSAAAGAVLSGLQQQQYRPRQVAHAVFALSKLQACDQQLLDVTAAAFGREAQAYSPLLLSMLAWVCVLAGRQQRLPEGLLQELVQCSRQQLGEFSGDQLASLLRGVLAMPAQHSSSIDQLMGEAQALLPQVLPATNTAVLTELIQSLTWELRLLRQGQQQTQQAPPRSQGTPPVHLLQHSSSSGSSDDTSSTPSKGAPEQQQAVVCAMLQDCVAEWGKASRMGQLHRWQAAAVERALQGCGQDSLAAVAKQVCESVTAATADQEQHEQQLVDAGEGGTALAAGRQDKAAAGATWVDSFVASTH